MAARVRDLAGSLGLTWEGDGEKELARAASLEAAGADELTFVAALKYAPEASASPAGCLIVPLDFPNPGGRTVLRAADPRLAFAQAVAILHPPPKPVASIHPSAVIATSALIGENVAIGPHTTIGGESRIGANTIIGPGCAIGRRVVIGVDCTLHARVTVYDDVEIGGNVILHSGAVLGADGFGFVRARGGYVKFPQIGKVIIERDVEIGANSCVDRAALGTTWIGEGTKLDNMVHIAHNCRIGKHVVVAAQTGFSGGVVIEDNAVIGGQVGIGDKARVGAGAVLGSGSGILTSKIVKPGEVVWGTPARPIREYLNNLAHLSRLPDLRRQLETVMKRLKEIEGALGIKKEQ